MEVTIQVKVIRGTVTPDEVLHLFKVYNVPEDLVEGVKQGIREGKNAPQLLTEFLLLKEEQEGDEYL